MDQNQCYKADNCLCGLETLLLSWKEKANRDHYKEKGVRMEGILSQWHLYQKLKQYSLRFISIS